MQDVGGRTDKVAGTKAAQRSKLMAFGLPVLLWAVSVGSLAAVMVVSGPEGMRGSGVRRAAAAAVCAVAPLYAAWRMGSDAVRGFKAAGMGAKVGRVAALVLMGAAVVVHAVAVGMLGGRKLSSSVEDNAIGFFAVVGAAIGLLSTAGLLAWEGAGRAARKWVRVVLYVVLAAAVAACLLGYLIVLAGLADKDTFEAKVPEIIETRVSTQQTPSGSPTTIRHNVGGD